MSKKLGFISVILAMAISCIFGMVACDGDDANKVAVESVTLNKQTLALEIDGTETLIATVNPENATDKAVAWSSSNSAVAAVDGTGKVTAKAAGSATVTATAGEQSATCSVTVSETVSYTVTQTQWERGILNLINPLPSKEQNFTARGTFTGVVWDRKNGAWDTEELTQTDEFEVDGDKYLWHLSVGSEYEDKIYEQWTEQDGYYLQTRYDYWRETWDKEEYLSDVPCAEDELELDGTPHFNLGDFEWTNFQYDEAEHCYKSKAAINSKYGQMHSDGGNAVIYNVLTDVKVYCENGKIVKFTMSCKQETSMKGSMVVTFTYGDTEIVLPQVD